MAWFESQEQRRLVVAVTLFNPSFCYYFSSPQFSFLYVFSDSLLPNTSLETMSYSHNFELIDGTPNVPPTEIPQLCGVQCDICQYSMLKPCIYINRIK